MRCLRFIALAFPILGLVSPGLHGADVMNVGDEVASTLLPVAVPVAITHDQALAGYILAITYDTTLVTAIDITVVGTVAEGIAEGVFGEIFDPQGGFTLGVILDFEAPFDGQTIPPSPDTPQTAAFVTLALDTIENDPVVVPLELTDGVLNNPPLDNTLLLEGGGEVGAADGLEFQHGSLTIDLMFLDSLELPDFVIPAEGLGEGRVLMSNPSGPVIAFVVRLEHPVELDLVGIDIGGTVTELAGAEFVDTEIGADGGTVTVIMDVEPPFAGQTLPVGMQAAIVDFVYACDSPPVEPDPATVHPVAFDAAVTQLSYQGFTLTPILTGGVASCEPVMPPVPPNTVYYCGRLSEDGLSVLGLEGNPGGFVTASFFFSDPDDAADGFQIAVVADCVLDFVEGTFTVEGTLIETLGAEFVTSSVDNDPQDGDGCELVAAILLDALPPFDGQQVPVSVDPLEIGRVDLFVDPDAEIGTCPTVEFVDGIDGGGAVPIENLVVVGVEGIVDFETFGAEICVVADTVFRRGDCNVDGSLNLADGIFLLGHLFQMGPIGSCVEACNFDGVGNLGLVDAIYAFDFLFTDGPDPPAPYPGCGSVPGVECEVFGVCP